MSNIIEHLTDKDFLVSKDGIKHSTLGERIENIEKEFESDNQSVLKTQIKNNIISINEIKNRLNELQSFYDVSLLEVDYTLTKEKFEYVMVTMLGE